MIGIMPQNVKFAAKSVLTTHVCRKVQPCIVVPIAIHQHSTSIATVNLNVMFAEELVPTIGGLTVRDFTMSAVIAMQSVTMETLRFIATIIADVKIVR